MYSEAEVQERIKRLRGFEELVGELGYKFKRDNGQWVRFRGASVRDEGFAHDVLGMLNISEALRMIEDEPPTTHELKIDPAMVAHISERSLKPAVIRKMTPARRDEPILMVETRQGLYVIDGNHRLQRRIQDGLVTVNAFVLDQGILPHIAITVEYRDLQGNWNKVDAREAGIL